MSDLVTAIRPEGPGWTRLRALTRSHAVGPNRLPQLRHPLQVGRFRFLRFSKSVDSDGDAISD
jgi:hypothetical protein